MTGIHAPSRSKAWLASCCQLKTWHLGLLVLYTAIAIVNVQDQRQADPSLIALASAGLVAYPVIGWLAWQGARRFEARLGPLPVLALYLIAMAGLFLVATIIYLVIENQYLVGGFRIRHFLGAVFGSV
ncbi:hypothetical protein SAMN05444166_5560 [Singulisphaera sp. GP187]|uniref:hypothetical protein n=1 Tax=Singulisphaera sp. GP187 TaxID=1882752 RepID=UPI0009275D11|nr:hypothetical protein [Singulisphaera sp. GP187]SIO58080.1 hypothetical protein SAMN05444166_5560 [Singulisphaera sp. GP187]